MRKVARSIDPKYGPITVHGFRATLKTWAGEETEFDPNIVEAALAHGTVRGKVEAAYRRADFFEKRRRLMIAWSKFAGSATTSNNVVALRA
jgi:hypothetical protein